MNNQLTKIEDDLYILASEIQAVVPYFDTDFESGTFSERGARINFKNGKHVCTTLSVKEVMSILSPPFVDPCLDQTTMAKVK